MVLSLVSCEHCRLILLTLNTLCIIFLPVLLLLHQHTEVPVAGSEEGVEVTKDGAADHEEAGLDQEHRPGEGGEGVVVDRGEERS